MFSTALFAQDETASPGETALSPELPAESSAETAVQDRIAAAERALSLGDDTTGAITAPSPASALNILRVLLTLAVVAAAIYGLVYLFKRLARLSMTRDPFLKILASVPLGTNRSAHIISAGSQAWLVGVAEHGVNLISEIEDKELLDVLLLEDSRRSADAAGGHAGGRFPDFKALLRRLGMPVDTTAPPSPEDIRKRGEKLKQMRNE